MLLCLLVQMTAQSLHRVAQHFFSRVGESHFQQKSIQQWPVDKNQLNQTSSVSFPSWFLPALSSSGQMLSVPSQRRVQRCFSLDGRLRACLCGGRGHGEDHSIATTDLPRLIPLNNFHASIPPCKLQTHSPFHAISTPVGQGCIVKVALHTPMPGMPEWPCEQGWIQRAPKSQPQRLEVTPPPHG